MLHVNENYSKIKASYLFTEIAHRVSAHQAANPDAKIIRLGIGDVTEPLAPAIIEAMHKAAPFALLADFKVAERNIELPASLLLRGVMGMGTGTKGCFKEYGGLEGLLYAERKRFAVRERHSLLGGSLACILAECLH